MKGEFTEMARLLKKATELDLYVQLVQQLSKDFRRAGCEFPFPQDSIPSAIELVGTLKETIYRLLMESFDTYLNLMYAADVPEKKFKDIRGADAVEVSTEITQLLLEREWQKVWTRHWYKNQ